MKEMPNNKLFTMYYVVRIQVTNDEKKWDAKAQ